MRDEEIQDDILPSSEGASMQELAVAMDYGKLLDEHTNGPTHGGEVDPDCQRCQNLQALSERRIPVVVDSILDRKLSRIQEAAEPQELVPEKIEQKIEL